MGHATGHSKDCYLSLNDGEGECDCGYQEVLDDDAAEIAQEIDNEENGPTDDELRDGGADRDDEDDNA